MRSVNRDRAEVRPAWARATSSISSRAFDMDVRDYDILRLTEDQEDALGVRFALPQ